MKQIIFILFISTQLIFSQSITVPKLSKKDIINQISIAKKAPCSEKENKLYLINNTYIFWAQSGNCMDNHYSYVLLGKGLKELCFERETIAGPRTKCAAGLKDMFNTILKSKKEKNLGLDRTYSIKLIYTGK
jgi:hypothetical protein